MGKSQKQQILEHLEAGIQISPIWALNFVGCFRLAPRICELKEEGHDIRNVAPKGTGYAIYALVKEEE